MRKERIDVRVESELLEELEIIAERAGMNRSEVLREAVASYVMDNKDGWNSTGLKVNIPNRLAEKVSRHIMNGDARDAEEAIVLALDRWTSELEDYYLHRRDKIESIVARNVKNDAAMTKLRKETLEKLKR
jgi:predicted DNA-binding protein